VKGLRVDCVRQSYGRQEILKGVDLALETGGILALLGASGCGKTTLLRAIAGFERPEAGTILLDGRTLEAPGVHLPTELRRIGFVPQEGTLFPHLTVAGNIAFGLDRTERRSGRVAEVLHLAKLDGLDRRYPHQISGGQQQRVALARALAPRPSLVLLDEPFNALDLALRRDIAADVIAMLRASAATAILVTHDPLEAFASADLVAVMHAGCIMQCAPPAIVYRCPASMEVARLTGGVIELAGIVRGNCADTVLGRIPLMPDGGVTEGDARIMLRPEQIVPTLAGQGVAVQRIGSMFRGDHALVTVAVGGVELRLRVSGLMDACGPLYLQVVGTGVAFRRKTGEPEMRTTLNRVDG
jgi:iron(III) transport system ATP-binding protein